MALSERQHVMPVECPVIQPDLTDQALGRPPALWITRNTNAYDPRLIRCIRISGCARCPRRHRWHECSIDGKLSVAESTADHSNHMRPTPWLSHNRGIRRLGLMISQKMLFASCSQLVLTLATAALFNVAVSAVTWGLSPESLS